MSDSDAEQNGNPGLATAVSEVQGHFPNDAALQDALGLLTTAGYDRADLSLPDEQQAAMPTPNETAENPTDGVDQAQLRTMGTGMAAYAGAVAAGGAVIATGGAAALAVGAAAALGIGGAAAANATGQAAEHAQVADHDRKGAEGHLILAVRTESDEEIAEVTTLMQQAGATDVQQITREDQKLTAGVSSASWTGA